MPTLEPHGGVRPGRSSRREPVGLSGVGDFAVRVVGTSYYQPALAGIADGTRGPPEMLTAVLVPEPDNPHDRNAVRVDIGGVAVGYLARPAAKAFRSALREIGLRDRATSCAARLVGGRDREDASAIVGVRLDFEWPLRTA